MESVIEANTAHVGNDTQRFSEFLILFSRLTVLGKNCLSVCNACSAGQRVVAGTQLKQKCHLFNSYAFLERLFSPVFIIFADEGPLSSTAIITICLLSSVTCVIYHPAIPDSDIFLKDLFTSTDDQFHLKLLAAARSEYHCQNQSDSIPHSFVSIKNPFLVMKNHFLHC